MALRSVCRCGSTGARPPIRSVYFLFNVSECRNPTLKSISTVFALKHPAAGVDAMPPGRLAALRSDGDAFAGKSRKHQTAAGATAAAEPLASVEALAPVRAFSNAIAPT